MKTPTQKLLEDKMEAREQIKKLSFYNKLTETEIGNLLFFVKAFGQYLLKESLPERKEENNKEEICSDCFNKCRTETEQNSQKLLEELTK